MRSLLDGMRVAFCLSTHFDVDRLLGDLETLRRFPQASLPTSYGHRRWSGVCLFGPNGRADSLACSPGPYEPTPALSVCAYLPSVLSAVDAPKRSVRVLSLAPGARVFEHYDPDSSFDRGTIRLHVPIVTHPDVDFFIGGSRYRMRPGELWYGDFSLPHAIRNRSPIERVHLVMDVENTPGVRGLFPRGFRDASSLRAARRALLCWVSDRKTHVKRLLAGALA